MDGVRNDEKFWSQPRKGKYTFGYLGVGLVMGRLADYWESVMKLSGL
jgi:hypothetical protein